MAQSEAPAVTLTETRARQARWGRPVFWVLLVSLILSGAALFLVWLFNAHALTSVEPDSQRLPPEGSHSPLMAPTPPKPPTARDL